MANENDIFRKMDALLRKHHADASSQSTFMTTEAELPSDESKGLAFDQPATAPEIPILTEIVEEHALDNELEQGLIPVLTETIETQEEESYDFSLELDLDPYYNALHSEGAPEKEVQTATATSEAIEAPSLVPEEMPLPDFPELEFEPSPQETETTAEHIAEPIAMPEPLPMEPVAAPILSEPEIVAPAAPTQTAESATLVSDSLTEQILRSLDQHLQKAVENSLAPQVANSVDKALSSMLDQFSIHIEYMVQEAITKELQKQFSALKTMSAGNCDPSPSSNSSAQADDSV